VLGAGQLHARSGFPEPHEPWFGPRARRKSLRTYVHRLEEIRLPHTVRACDEHDAT
jgi:hypothetical protein